MIFSASLNSKSRSMYYLDVFQEKMYGFAGDSIKGKPGVVEIIAMINWTLVTQGRSL